MVKPVWRPTTWFEYSWMGIERRIRIETMKKSTSQTVSDINSPIQTELSRIPYCFPITVDFPIIVSQYRKIHNCTNFLKYVSSSLSTFSQFCNLESESFFFITKSQVMRTCADSSADNAVSKNEVSCFFLVLCSRSTEQVFGRCLSAAGSNWVNDLHNFKKTVSSF